MRITLKVTAGVHKGRVFTFDVHDTFLVGRSERAHFQLPDKDRYFSRIHFLIELNPPLCRLMDMRSRNGTYVNDEKVTSADLKHGDKIRAGRTIFRVSMEGQTEAKSAESDSVVPDTHVSVNPAVPEPTTQKSTSLPDPSPSTRKRIIAAGACLNCGARLPGGLAPAQAAVWTHICPKCRTKVSKEPQPIPGYHLIRKLDQGGMGVVHVAVKTQDGAPVALKTLNTEEGVSDNDRERFLREALVLKGLKHPHIVPFRDMGQANNLIYLVMDLVPGLDAFEILQAEGPLDIRRAVNWTIQVLKALDYAHAEGIVHRDIKPRNMLVSKRRGREWIHVADFGLARVYQTSKLSGLSLMNRPGGTYYYMPPEQVTGFRNAKPPADQYSAAATLYHLLTGQFIFDPPEHTVQWLLIILHDEPVPIRQRRADIPERLAAIVHRGLEKEPRKRFADVGEMREALSELGQQSP